MTSLCCGHVDELVTGLSLSRHHKHGTDLKMLRLMNSFQRQLKTFLFESVYRQQRKDRSALWCALGLLVGDAIQISHLLLLGLWGSCLPTVSVCEKDDRVAGRGVSVCVCQLLRQLSAECHRPHMVTEPQTVDDHYVTVNDPTTVHSLLAGRKVDEQPWSPGARPVSSAGHSASGVVLRLRRRPTSPPVESRHQSVILYDKQQMNRYAKRTSRHPSYLRLKSTPTDRSYLFSPPSVYFFVLYNCLREGCTLVLATGDRILKVICIQEFC